MLSKNPWSNSVATVPNRHPAWLRKRASSRSTLAEMKALLDGLSLHTVCESAQCPNQGECFAKKTATFLIMGDVCTRECRFCAIRSGQPSALDRNEPSNVAQAVNKLDLKHVVVTSVTRDDLPDGGARHFAETVNAIRKANPRTTIEVLIPDFQGSINAVEIVVASSPDIVAHNVETIPRLYAAVRPKADYCRSLYVLNAVKSIDGKMLTKSGFMLGLGEKHKEVVALIEDLRTVCCDFLIIGQYLAPSSNHFPVIKYVHPFNFERYRTIGERMGFSSVVSGPFVRSSYNALEAYLALQQSRIHAKMR